MHPIPSLLLIAALLANALLPGRAQPAAYPPRSAQDAEPQAEPVADRQRIRLAVEMAETKEGKTVTVSWLVEGWDSLAEQSDLELNYSRGTFATDIYGQARYLWMVGNMASWMGTISSRWQK